MDAEIEVRASKPIARLFAEDGECAFRQMEATLCAELSTRSDSVIATGGGALIDPTNRELMVGSGAAVCLRCEADELLKRLQHTGGPKRPLLDVDDRCAEIERLLELRSEAYAAIPWQIDTTRLSVEEVVARVVEIASAVTLTVHHPAGQYDIHVGEGMLKNVGAAVRAVGTADSSAVAVVSNPVVAPLYAARVSDSLEAVGLRPLLFTVPDGEPHKTLETVESLYEQFLDGGLDRWSTVLSLGGGVTGDVAGFAAATFMRGLRFVQVPTTLLAMVDASVGGKTGVDLPQGKNLVGAFKQPALVMIDPSVLATLLIDEMRCGLAELLKHAIIDDPGLFFQLEAEPGDPSTWGGDRRSAWIARSLGVKIRIVEQDPFEQGRRAVLNLGHTVGHALEKLSDLRLRHGEAVSIGMVAAARISAELGWADPSLSQRIAAVLDAWGLPVRCPPFDVDAICQTLAYDKKKRMGELRWVLPRGIGQVEMAEDVPSHIIASVLNCMGATRDR
jgi:3-dehydroquinate synthase